MLTENHLNKESKILDLAIYLNRYYGEQEAPSSFNSTVYHSIFIVKSFFYYLKKMATISGSVFLELLMTMEQRWNTTQVISSS